MKISSVKVFDPDLTSKSRGLPDLKMHKNPKQKAPRPDARKHTLEEAKPKKVINKEEESNLKKTVLKKSTLERHLARIEQTLDPHTSGRKQALPNPQSNHQEDLDMDQRLDTIEDLNAWIDEMQGRTDVEDEFGPLDRGPHF